MIKGNPTEKMTDIEREFHESETMFIADAYMDEELVAYHLDSVDTLGFNTWSYLMKAVPKFDEIRIRVATEEDLAEFERIERGVE